MSETVLVTGGSGYLGAWCVVRALQAGYRVRTTVRDLAREAEVRAMVASQVDADDRLEVVAADLLSDAGWAEAVAGCAYVLHVASPFPATAPKDENELIAPAREGTLRVLKAAVAAGVKRVVLTSSVAAVSYGHPRERDAGPPMTEADWTDPTAPDVPAYHRSKTLAERAAREFMAREGGATELVSVNPTGIFGPTLGTDIGTSLVIVRRLLKGDMPGLPRIGLTAVDVRDTADLHLIVMTRPEAAGGRYIAAGEFLWFADVARLLRETQPAAALSRRVPTRRIPDFVLKLVGIVDPQARAISGELGRRREVSAAAARALGWTPRPAAETFADSARSLEAIGAL